MTTWETVVVETDSNDISTTTLERVRVPGGWLYRTVVYATTMKNETQCCALAFVPEGICK